MSRNPKRYREMRAPHASPDAANDAFAAFFAAVELLRIEHRIADVHILGIVRYSDGEEEFEGTVSGHIGDNLRALPMIAEAYGRAKADHEAMLVKLTTRKR